jgi:hypothetical protein
MPSCWSRSHLFPRSSHRGPAREPCPERGATETEVREAIQRGAREPAEHGCFLSRLSFRYGAKWQDRFYAIKQVAPVAIEEENEIVVITVYTFYF